MPKRKESLIKTKEGKTKVHGLKNNNNKKKLVKGTIDFEKVVRIGVSFFIYISYTDRETMKWDVMAVSTRYPMRRPSKPA